VPAHAQPGDHPWSVKDVLKQESLSQVDIATDGNRILWVKETPNFDKDRDQSDVYLTYRDDPHGDAPSTLQLTRTGDNRAPRWSPDGQHIAFLSSREKDDNEQTQIWMLDPRGGSPYRLTSLENGVQGFRWLDDGTLLFSAAESDSRYEKALEEAKDDVNVIEDTTLYEPVRLFTIEVSSKDVRRVSHNDFPIEEFAPDPSGRYVVYSVDPSPVDADARNQPLQYLLDLQTGVRTEIFDEPYFDPSGVQWTPGGEGFYASDSHASDPEHEGAGIQKLYYFSLADRSYEEVPLGWANGIGYGGYQVTPEGIHVQLANGPHLKPRFYRKTPGGWQSVDVSDERLRHSTSVALGADGETIVFSHSRPDTPPSYRVGTYEQGTISDDEVLTSLNGYLDDLPMPRSEVVEWSGARGDTVNGILYYPLNYNEDREYPLVTVIHGGPSGVDLDAWRLGWTVYPPLLAQRGAFVFRPNYHGSGHHGLDFVESIKGKYYELEIPDIVSGIDYLADERGLVDTDSLGVMGWSNGAILTIQLTVEHPDMFKVAAPGAGDVNWISDYGNCAFGARFDNSYFKGPPWEYVDHYIEKSPLFEMEKVVTPTLIHFGTEDRAVPSEQGWQHYRALQQIGTAPVRYLRYPGQPHGLRRLSHQTRKVEEDLKWIDTYLFGTTSMEDRVDNRLLADDAPLSLLERVPQAARVEGRYGRSLNGVLAPETVTLGDTLTVGRFEVTRAQFHAFDDRYAVPDGTANHPANGLSHDQAQAYVEWLSEQTGRSYRLPTQAELKALKAHRSGAAENTPAYWAGYTPTPDEYDRLRPRLSAQPVDELLMPVGSRPPGLGTNGSGPLVYDVGGNVAEWATVDDGLRAMNGSALTLKDDKAASAPDVPAAFVGLRVVQE
jgi:dipeptidyl aminopeptidase/acylaminoacyl peptidase